MADAEEKSAARVAVTPHGLRTRDALMRAGRTLIADGGLDGLTVAGIVREAGVAKGTFYVHFTDRDAFVASLVEAFDERALEAIATAVDGKPAGPERMLAAIEAYLDACLDDPVVKGLAGEARGARPGELGGEFASQLAAGLRGVGWRAEAGRGGELLVALVGEAARIERAAGQRDAATRRALRRFVSRADLRAPE